VSSAAEQEAVQEGRAPDLGLPAQPAPVLNGSPRVAPAVPVWPGAPTPLGARFRTGPDGVSGTNFALWAGGAESVELCLFDYDGDGRRTAQDGADGTGPTPRAARAPRSGCPSPS
jgi:isoamylase